MGERPAIHIRLHPDVRSRLKSEAELQHLDQTAITTIALTEYFKRLDVERKKSR